jgi:hypothetical protein
MASFIFGLPRNGRLAVGADDALEMGGDVMEVAVGVDVLGAGINGLPG